MKRLTFSASNAIHIPYFGCSVVDNQEGSNRSSVTIRFICTHAYRHFLFNLSVKRNPSKFTSDRTLKKFDGCAFSKFMHTSDFSPLFKSRKYSTFFMSVWNNGTHRFLILSFHCKDRQPI